MDPAASLNVLHSSSRASSRSRSSQRAELLLELDVVAAGQQAAGFQLQQHRGDQQELGGDIQVEGRPASAPGWPRTVDDVRQGDLPQVDLLAGDQMQEQVEGALEDGGAHRVGHTPTIPAGPFLPLGIP